MSGRQAADRFGVSPASAIRWCAREKEAGSPAAMPRGGDRWSARIDGQADLILSLVDEVCDITLKELQGRLAERGHRFSIGSLWRFFDRHAITWKKRPRMRASKTGPTS
jgi:transposase